MTERKAQIEALGANNISIGMIAQRVAKKGFITITEVHKFFYKSFWQLILKNQAPVYLLPGRKLMLQKYLVHYTLERG